jgi:hypothetical protein
MCHEGNPRKQRGTGIEWYTQLLVCADDDNLLDKN